MGVALSRRAAVRRSSLAGACAGVAVGARDPLLHDRARARCCSMRSARYTPVFRLVFELLPGVDLFRRPADATLPPRRARGDPRRLSRPSLSERTFLPAEAAVAPRRWSVAVASLLRRRDRARGQQGHARHRPAWPIAQVRLVPRRRARRSSRALPALARTHPRAGDRCVLVRRSSSRDLALNNGPNESTALAAGRFTTCCGRTAATRPLGALEGAASGRQPRPRRARRPRLPLAECEPRASLRQRARLQSGAARPLQRSDRRRGPRRAAGPAQLLAPVPVLPLDARRSARPALHRHRRAGRARSTRAEARRSHASRADTARVISTRIRAPCPRLRVAPNAVAIDQDALLRDGRWPASILRRRCCFGAAAGRAAAVGTGP